MSHASDPPSRKRLSWESRCEIVMKVESGLFSHEGRREIRCPPSNRLRLGRARPPARRCDRRRCWRRRCRGAGHLRAPRRWRPSSRASGESRSRACRWGRRPPSPSATSPGWSRCRGLSGPGAHPPLTRASYPRHVPSRSRTATSSTKRSPSSGDAPRWRSSDKRRSSSRSAMRATHHSPVPGARRCACSKALSAG